ncbi:MAG: hypothetical protein ABIQ60_16270 [Burkholderiaceae bacterium]
MVDTFAGGVIFKPAWAALAASALAAGAFLAWHHPLWAPQICVAFALWVMVAFGVRGLWLFVLPAAVPILNFSPWTGWSIFEEFDLLVLGALAAGLAQLAWSSTGNVRLPSQMQRVPGATKTAMRGNAVALVLGGICLFGLWRGAADAGGWSFDWFGDYSSAANSVRVVKSQIYALALWPLLQDELRRAMPLAIARFARGMQAGLTVVGLAVLWERTAYPGILEFSDSYRATALFWEMHVGGAAIDGYLALATPFAAWALWSARTRRGWAAAAGLALLSWHAGLTTFSRGVYLAVAVPLLLLGAAWWRRRFRVDTPNSWRALAKAVFGSVAAAAWLIVGFSQLGYAGVVAALLSLMTLLLVMRRRRPAIGWRSVAAMALGLALLTEAVVVIGGGSFMRTRIAATERDFGSRLAHWQNGLGLLHGATDWLIGVGPGRMPARYAREVANAEFPGTHTLVTTEQRRNVLRIAGPSSNKELSGLYALTQRVSLRPTAPYHLRAVARVDEIVDVDLSVCERHLLYARRCRAAQLRVFPDSGGWQTLDIDLEGPALESGAWYAPRLGMFALSVAGVGASLELAEISLTSFGATELLSNRDFSQELAHWFPVARSYFLPWHIDNLALELLIERGLLGLVAFGVLIGWAIRHGAGVDEPLLRIAPFIAASLVGALLVGSVSSLTDVPRVSFLLLLMVLFALAVPAEKAAVSRS